jgi:hypothetical protein|tara:strand:+ start:309 stop:545 length:237 start_codon:yes stop_codon:yes gene_type:complete
MAIYRVDCGHDDDGHMGYEYYATLRAAKRVVAAIKRRGRDNPSLFLAVEPSIESRPTPRNKREWVALLNDWGSHKENG